MKNKILKILNESEKSLDAISIMRKMKSTYTAEDLRNLLDALDLLCDKGEIVQRKNNCYMPFERSKYLKGKLSLTSKGNGYLLLDGKDLHIYKDRLNGACDGDTVICEVIENEKGYEGKVKKVIERNLGGSLGEIYFDSSNNMKCKFCKKDVPFSIVLENVENMNLVEGDIVKIKPIKEMGKTLFCEVEEKVCHKNEPGSDIKMVLAEFNIPYKFSEEALEEAKNMPNKVLESELVGRVDLRDEEIFTIDGADTKDIDDAISLKMLDNGNYLLKVSIADVSHYVKEGSALKKEAFLRGNSYYVGGRVNPMLPVELSNGICSLNPLVDRLAVTCEMEINNSGDVVNKKLYKSVIRSKKKMTYDAVNQVFEGNTLEDYKPFESTLKNMLELSKILKENKHRRGEIDFVSSEVKPTYDDEGYIIEIKKRLEGLGENMIEDFMVAANETVSSIMTEHGVPSIYRVHGTPAPKKIREFIQKLSLMGHKITGKINFNSITPRDIQNILEQLKKTKEYPILNKMMLRCMQKAIYDTSNIGHFGIASKDYTHFTSPIRRYSDLELHYLIDEFIFKKNTSSEFISKVSNELPYITEHISETERIAQECEYAVNDMKIAEYMEGVKDENGNVIREGHIGEEYEATIDGMLKNGFFVETDNAINGFVKLEILDDYLTFRDDIMAYTNKKKQVAYRMGDKVIVKCIGASKENRTVDFTSVKKVA